MGNKIINFVAIDEITPFINSLTNAERSELGKVPHDLLILRIGDLIECKNSFAAETREVILAFGVFGTKEAFLATALGASNSF